MAMRETEVMKKLNILNRCVELLLRVLLVLGQYFGLVIITYDIKLQEFRQSWPLRKYSNVLLISGVICLLVGLWANLLSISFELMLSICCAARFYILLSSEDLMRQFNELREVVLELRLLARHPNIFRLTHLLLILLALQSLTRTLVMLIVQTVGIKNSLRKAINIWISMIYDGTFIFETTINICLFIVLIACYDELHHCTRRISNDVRTLRMAQRLEGGQLVLRTEELRRFTVELMRVRTDMFNIAVGLIKHFRFHLLCAFVNCFVYVFGSFTLNGEMFYNLVTGLANMAFYCTVFELFVWKSKLSRSFWNFHLLNYHQAFDRTIDELLHRELLEEVKVSVYGIALNMRNFCKVLTICGLFVFVKYGDKMKKRS